jgi:hypothetical protein
LAVNPLIQRSFQKRTEVPSPTSIFAKLSKTCSASTSFRCGSPCQGLVGSVRRSHCQRVLSASPCSLRSLIPSPLSRSGLQQISQATRHCPPFTFFLPA